MNKKWNESTISELAPLIKNKEVSPVEVTRAVIDQIETLNNKLNAYINVTVDKALEQAEVAEKEVLSGNYRGPLHGIPMAIKDNIYFANEVTTMGSKIHKEFVSKDNATVVTKLKEAGTIFTGKLNLHEYAWGATNNNPHFGPCRNPWDLERISGGSSGGSGVSTASHMTIAALGTDTGGSIRIPSSFCGITGLKPTHGLVSKYGAFPLGWSLDHIGPMAKSAKDAAYILEAISGYDAKDPTSVNRAIPSYSNELTGSIKGLKIGINEEYFFNNVDAPIEKTVRNAISSLEKYGATIEVVKLPTLSYVEYAEMITIITEASAIHHDNLIKREEDFGDDVRFLLKLGEIPSAVDYLQAQQIRLQLNREFKDLFTKVDVLITPTHPVLPPKIGQDMVSLNGTEVSFLDQIIRFTGPFNLTGLPAVTVPCGFVNNLPVGMQIVGPAFKEGRILNVAHALEQIHPEFSQTPSLIQYTNK
ncbi:Asp-tRNA(Asn)/Glu-tRNA(Gln) amidotransferase GatCAB subunit A [Bacillus massiliigorillae]|uniref:Asp-tRNA(Asn)/Glu-tRNA(Gln) amidotransferase GatCAB subunit A n=1 Tax=Bacillus massiliigorillae TaxID=1243664 RepID=UPI00039E363F|nr:Asp-tRNA(Asn)/Glu-tRNA(Gln) amidotransferase GatCAB subunit A [Bacillus massiliigorillae]